jgi:GNAT superfamily N-acetyltransferase
MNRLPGGTPGVRRDDGDQRRHAAGAAPGVVVRPEPYDGPISRSLVAALIVDIEERYVGDDEPDDPEAEWALGIVEVTPPRGVFLVAYLDRRPVGCGALRPLPDAGADVAEIKRMYTSPSARRRGVSRAVLARLESEATGFGYRRLYLQTGLRQPEAMALYGASGYRRIANFGRWAASELTACFAKDLPLEPASRSRGGRHHGVAGGRRAR